MTAVAMGFHDNGQPHRMRGFIRQDDLQRIASRGYILIIAAICIASCLSCFGLWWWGETGWNQAQTAYDALGAADVRVRAAEAKVGEIRQRAFRLIREEMTELGWNPPADDAGMADYLWEICERA